jgi:PKD repeat protein
MQMTWTSSGNVQFLVSIVNRIATITASNANWTGSETIIFRATDPAGLWDDDSAVFVVTRGDTAPNAPGSPIPADGASAAAISSNLRWSGGDPDGDPVLFDVYFGTSTAPSIVSHNQSSLSYDPGTLRSSTTYYWKIVAWDDTGRTTAGLLWHFTTASSSGGGGGGVESGDDKSVPPVVLPNITPVANLSAGEPYQGFVDTIIEFNALYSFDPDGNITSWFWEFGDGTNETGMIVSHRYAQKGSYPVTLTVTDDEGASQNVTVLCVVLQPNQPPSAPSITGPTRGTKGTVYLFTAVSNDPENDQILYTFDWGDSLLQSGSMVPSGMVFSMDHVWVAAGRYQMTVVASDNQTISSSEYIVYIDAVPLEGIGLLLDNDSDGTYDAFYSNDSQQIFPIQKEQDHYTIDHDGDGDWDVSYSTTTVVSSYQEPTRTYGLEIIIAVLAIALYLLWRRRLGKKQ